MIMTKRTPAQLEKDAAKIYGALKKNGPLNAEGICAATKLPIESVRLPIRKLRERKEVKLHGKGTTRAQQYAAR
jgi:transcription initiation factor IIE alpha subunit